MSGGLQVSLDTAAAGDNVARAARIIASRPGPENAISAEALAEQLDVSPSTVRNWPLQICREYNVPVGYCDAGYYRICSPDQLERETQKFVSQAERAHENIRARAKAYHGTSRVTYGGGRRVMLSDRCPQCGHEGLRSFSVRDTESTHSTKGQECGNCGWSNV